MFFKFQTAVTTLLGRPDGYILIESMISLSLISFILITLIPHLSLNMARLEEGKEKIEMMRVLHDYSYQDGVERRDGPYTIYSTHPHDISIQHNYGQLEERIWLQDIR